MFWWFSNQSHILRSLIELNRRWEHFFWVSPTNMCKLSIIIIEKRRFGVSCFISVDFFHFVIHVVRFAYFEVCDYLSFCWHRLHFKWNIPIDMFYEFIDLFLATRHDIWNVPNNNFSTDWLFPNVDENSIVIISSYFPYSAHFNSSYSITRHLFGTLCSFNGVLEKQVVYASTFYVIKARACCQVHVS